MCWHSQERRACRRQTTDDQKKPSPNYRVPLARPRTAVFLLSPACILPASQSQMDRRCAHSPTALLAPCANDTCSRPLEPYLLQFFMPHTRRPTLHLLHCCTALLRCLRCLRC
ncbi:hypothetical protein BS50DRAFT_13693 [Corynespora cassiicola Philippines]|uniref:Uncharacterized protein n=1 Tax=Corynespora cassiicola Philippines TaxID=1448308 RepID=A0A2T2P9L3_CORCC|nr:hypothetical protein BS50DRAFT_13693 [Corynespora cassiicola Philippines]